MGAVLDAVGHHQMVETRRKHANDKVGGGDARFAVLVVEGVEGKGSSTCVAGNFFLGKGYVLIAHVHVPISGGGVVE